jgi:DNA-binding HxlR family transcriptional regulator
MSSKRSGDPGARALQILTDSTDGLIVRELQAGARSLEELCRAIPTVSRDVLEEHLQGLTRDGFLSGEPTGYVPPAGETYPPPGAGAVAFGILAVELNTRILRRLGRGACDTHQLQQELEVSERTLRRTLAGLMLQDLVASARGSAGRHGSEALLLELTTSGRVLTAIAFDVARVEWAALQLDGPPAQSTLGEFLGLLAPLAVVPRGISGVCRLVERYPRAPSQTVWLHLGDRAMTVTDAAGATTPDVRASGTPPAWDHALTHDETDEILISGNTAIFHLALHALQGTR